MGCANCSSGGGTPRGCGNHGTCSSGGCNKLEVYDWLANITMPSGYTPYDIVEIRFKNSRKGFYRNTKGLNLYVGDVVVVETSPGYDVGVVSVTGELARIQVSKKAPDMKPGEVKKIIRVANQDDIDKWSRARSLEQEVMYQARTLAVNLNLEMKISDVEYQGDLTKATFYYTADGRVDFRQLIKDMAEHFKIRIEMRQIGSRQEAARLGGIGSCGRELCCSTWLTDFRSVSTSAARYQQLSLNPQKLAGQCGKLKCCLNYELDMYLEAIKSFPKSDTRLHTERGSAFHIKTDVFTRQMWYAYDGDAGIGMGLIAMSPERVREIAKMNSEGVKPKELIEFVQETVIKEPDFSNVVGQDSLNRFEHAFKKKKKKKPKGNGNQQNSQQSNTQNSAKSAENAQQTVKAQPANREQKSTNRPPRDRRDRNDRNNGGNGNPPNQERKQPVQAKKPEGTTSAEGENKQNPNRRKKRPNNRKNTNNPNSGNNENNG